MKSFEIHKASLDNKFTGINTKVLGQAIGDLKYCGLKLYLYLASHPDNSNWTVNPSVYADWVGTDYASKGRSVRKIIDDGIADLIENNYIQIINEEEEKYYFSEQKIPKIEKQMKMEQIIPKNTSFTF